MTSRRISVLILCLAALAGAVAPAMGQYPEKSIRMIYPYAAGGSGDALARIFAEDFSATLGQTVIVDNRPGAGGNIGFAAAAQAAPDGYTLASVSPAFVINASLYAAPGFDPLKDFVPIASLSTVPNVLIVRTSLPVKSLAELVEHAKANPGKLNFGSSGVGTSIHIAAELLKFHAKIDMVHVPYRGAAQAGTDLAAGQLDLMFDSAPTALANVRSGKARALAVASKVRMSEMPDVPTTGEAGFPDVISEAWTGIVAPTGTPPVAIERLAAAAAKAVNDPKVIERLAKIGGRPVESVGAQFGAFLKAEFDRNAAIVKTTGMRAD